MAAGFDDAAPVHDEDAVGVGGEVEVVGDHDRRTARHQAAQGFDDAAGGHRVQARRRLVEDQDRGVAQDGAGDGQALELAAGQAGRVGVDPGVVAVGECDDEVVCVGRPGRFLDRPVAGSGAAAGDVGADRVVQDEGLLREQGDVRRCTIDPFRLILGLLFRPGSGFGACFRGFGSGAAAGGAASVRAAS